MLRFKSIMPYIREHGPNRREASSPFILITDNYEGLLATRNMPSTLMYEKICGARGLDPQREADLIKGYQDLLALASQFNGSLLVTIKTKKWIRIL